MTELLPDQETAHADGLVVTDLLADLADVTRRLADRIAVGDVLDAYLLAAGAVQIVEDYLQRDTFALRRAAAYLGENGLPAVVPAGIGVVATVGESIRATRRTDRVARRWCWRAGLLRDSLAHKVISGPPRTGAAELVEGHWLREHLPTPNAPLTRAVLRLPSCFRSFDQDPADLVRLARRYAVRHPDRGEPLLVLGVRTSGSYLAPLLAAALRADGYPDVRTATARPEHRLRPTVARSVRSVTRSGGRILLVDDPPSTGHAIRSVIGQLTRTGAAEDAVSLVLPLFDDAAPEALRGYDSILLHHPDWAIHRRLEPDTAGRALLRLLDQPGATVRGLNAPPPEPNRGHARTLLELTLPGGEQRTVAATGAGLGYLGRHALAVARALPEYLPRTYGFADGIVFRDWLPEDWRVTGVKPDQAAGFADYVRTRAEAMPAGTDRSVHLAGRQPVWEVASQVLEHGYGRLGVLLRPWLLEPLVRRLCAVRRPSVIDGATGLSHWFREHGEPRKVSADRRAFANTDLACYDPVFDLAGVDPGGRDREFVAALRESMPSDGERFLLYELVHLWDRKRDGIPAHRESARAVQRYVAARLLGGLTDSGSGALCALDVDGVLESDALGFPVLTPLAARSLRALVAHGYQPVLVTGRSLDEVRERCEHYGLSGGVAEYGAVCYLHATGDEHVLVSALDQRVLADLREHARRAPGVFVDQDYTHTVRAYRRNRAGERAGLGEDVLRGLLDALGPERERLRVISGNDQTDFVAAATDKGGGLELLAALLGSAERPARIAMAVGDTAADLPVLALAGRAFAPANADAAIHASWVRVRRHGYAAGLAGSVRALLGHRPGGCSWCRPPRQSARATVLLSLLDAQRAGARGLPAAIGRGVRALLRGGS